MQSIIIKEWYLYKEDLEASLKELISKGTDNKNVIELMLEMLNSSKLRYKDK